MQIAGRVVLLTGATGGLGRAIAGALAARGAKLVLSSRKGTELEQLVDSLPGNEHRFIVSDLAEPDAAAELVAAAGRIDILVANAALPGSGRLADLEAEHVTRAIRVNLEAPVQMARTLVQSMCERGEGHLLFVGSLSGRVAMPRSSVYSGTKFGLRGFALALREDLWGTGVGVSLVEPGFVREAGMFADSGAKPPPIVGTSSPGEVVDAVVDAIERNRAEVVVAPRRVKLASGIAYRRPRLAAWATRGNAAKVADQITKGQSDKR